MSAPTASTAAVAETPGREIDIECKPALSSRAIVMMNVGFFGIQFSSSGSSSASGCSRRR